jgi:hypothetical protein
MCRQSGSPHPVIISSKTTNRSFPSLSTKSALVTSQLPIEHWYEQIGAPTMAAAVLDRLIHCANKIHLKGESMRKKESKLDMNKEEKVKTK